jgi:hypothetical protein
MSICYMGGGVSHEGTREDKGEIQGPNICVCVGAFLTFSLVSLILNVFSKISLLFTLKTHTLKMCTYCFI